MENNFKGCTTVLSFPDISKCINDSKVDIKDNYGFSSSKSIIE